MKKNYLYAILTVTALAACSIDNDSQGDNIAVGQKITFQASLATPAAGETGTRAAIPLTGGTTELWLLPFVQDTPAPAFMEADATRGTQLTSASALASFGVSAYKHLENEDLDDKTPSFFYNLKAVPTATAGTYGFDQDFYWPASTERLTFMAYYPYNSKTNLESDSTLVVLSTADHEGIQTIDFTVNSSVPAQTDLMTAVNPRRSPSTTQTPSVDLAFQHNLAGVRFIVGSQFPTKGYVQKITLKNVYNRGTLTLSDGTNPASWAYTSTGNFTAINAANTQLDGTVGQALTPTDQTFMMIPATYGGESTAAIEIEFWSGGEPNVSTTLTASLANTTWEAGKTYTYEISSEKLTTLQIKNITFATTPAGAPRTGWETGDQVGLYVVKTSEGNGLTLRYSNVPCTYDKTTGKWSIAQVNDAPVIKYPGDSYYLYYPYDASLQGAPSDGAVVNATADEFFNSVKEAHSVKSNQEEMANFIKSDLQIAKAIAPENNGGAALPASNISAEMARQVGLARLKFATSKEITTTITRTNNGTPSNSGKTTIYPSSNFTSKVPNHSGTGGIYYFYTNAGEETTFNSVASDPNHWYQARNITLAAGAYTTDAEMNENLIQDYRYQWEFVESIYKYTNTSSIYQFTMPVTGIAFAQCWGASGGTGSSTYGRGAYVAGDIALDAQYVLYIAIGQQGSNSGTTGSWNGGAPKTNESSDGSGGGATDIRLNATAGSSTWNNATGLSSRIMVAAGGGGADDTTDSKIIGYTVKEAASAGGLWSVSCQHQDNTGHYNEGATQTAGGAAHNSTLGIVDTGSFGYANQSGQTSCAGGGGGYWGGACSDFVGQGGSSFISGHPGCVAIANANSTSPSTAGSDNSVQRATHYSGLYFTNTVMIDGAGYEWTTTKGNYKVMPNPTGGNYASGEGRTGNGYCIITVTYE